MTSGTGCDGPTWLTFPVPPQALAVVNRGGDIRLGKRRVPIPLQALPASYLGTKGMNRRLCLHCRLDP
jgi:hypothetical protein